MAVLVAVTVTLPGAGGSKTGGSVGRGGVGGGMTCLASRDHALADSGNSGERNELINCTVGNPVKIMA